MDANTLEDRIMEQLWERTESNPEITQETIAALQNDASRTSFGDDDKIIDSLIEIYRE